jgi:heat-inducible transcriptional repressor
MLMVVAWARYHNDRIVNAILIGPSRINHAKIIPVLDYTGRVIGRLLG